MPHCWKLHAAAHFFSFQNFNMKATGLLFLCCFVRLVQYVFMDEECTMTLKETGYDFVVGEWYLLPLKRQSQPKSSAFVAC